MALALQKLSRSPEGSAFGTCQGRLALRPKSKPGKSDLRINCLIAIAGGVDHFTQLEPGERGREILSLCQCDNNGQRKILTPNLANAELSVSGLPDMSLPVT